MGSWAYCLLLPVPPQPVDGAELETAKRSLLRRSVVPLLSARRWFFRRVAIERDRLGWLHKYSIAVYVGLRPEDSLGCLRAVLQHELTEKEAHAVLEVREWDMCFGKDYGGPAAQAAMREFVCEAAPVAIVEQRDPLDVGAKHALRDMAPVRGIAHWWAHLREGPVISDDEAEALLREAMQRASERRGDGG